MTTILNNWESGVWNIRTESGSIHRFDLDKYEVTRMTEGPQPKDSKILKAILRRDGDPVKLIVFNPIVVGFPAEFVLDVRQDGVYTSRLTTKVTEIEKVDNG